MPKQNDKLYQFAPLADYTLKQRISIHLADMLFFLCIKTLGMSARFEVRGYENLEAIEAAGQIPIYSFWHDRIFLSTYFWRKRGIVVLTSRSYDGEYIARFIQRFGFGAIRGSSSKGGARALVEMVKSMRAGHAMAFTVDGPHGPRYEAKSGPVFLAKKSGNPILPFVIEPWKYWTVNSWDMMQIPQPFSGALVIIGEPIYVDSKADDAEVELKLQEFQRSLDDLTRQGEEWSKRK